MSRPAGGLRFEINEGAIKPIACRAGGQTRLQFFSGQSAGDVRSQAFDLRDDAGNGFAIARIGNAFAPSDGFPFGDFHHDDISLGFGPAGDAKASLDRPSFAANEQGFRHRSAKQLTHYLPTSGSSARAVLMSISPPSMSHRASFAMPRR